MFKVVKIESLLWPVEISVPKLDGSGDHDTHEVKIEYKVLDSDEKQRNTENIDRYLNALRALSDTQVIGQELLAETIKLKKQFGVDVTDFVVGWDGIFNEDDSPMKFSKSQLKKLMKIPYMETAINDGFGFCQEGYAGKN